MARATWKMWKGRTAAGLVLAGATLVVAGPAAVVAAQPQPPDFGATVLVDQGLKLVARQGVDNDATVYALGDEFLVFTDETGLNIAALSCWYPTAGDDTVVMCPNLGSPVRVVLGDGDDRLLLSGEHFRPGFPASVGWEADLGDGDDVLDAARSATFGDFVGGAGADRFVSGVEEDLWYGGSGVDTVDYGSPQRDSSDDVTVHLEVDGAGSGGGPKASTEGAPAWEDVLWSTENAVGTRYDDELVGSDAGNDLDGGRGDDELSGGGGDDVLVGGAGDDTLFGGAGIDRASYRDRTAPVTVDRNDLGGHGGSGESDVYSGDVEGVIGTDAGDTLVGTGGIDRFIGDACLLAGPCPNWRGAGADTITAGGGMDDVHGGFGPDTIDGGAGDDGLNGGDGDDRILGGADFDLIIGGNGTDDCDIGPGGGTTSTCE
jgi:Ca2+-binding RTX toxin-like protein